MSVKARLVREARPARAFLAGSVLIGVATGAAVVAQAVLIADGIATVVTTGSAGGLDRTAWLLAGVIGIRAGLVWLQEVVAVRASAAVKSALRRRLLAHALRLGPSWLGGERSSELTTLATRGLDDLDPYFARYLPQSVLAATVPIGVACWLLRTDLLAATTVLVTLPLIPVFMALVGLATQARSRGRQRALTMLAHHFADVVAGLPTLRLFGRAKAQPDAVRRVTDRHRVLSMASLRLAFLSSLVLELLASVSVALVAVGVGLRLVEGRLGLETGLLVLVLAPEAYLPLRQLGAQFHASADGLAAAERVFAVLDTPVPRWGTRREQPDLWHEPLRLEGVTVRYPDRPGEFVVLTGPSGAGKSTALAVLLGFTEPECGVVSAGRHLQRDFDPAAWRSAFAWVPQRPGLLAGTVADNVRLGRPDASDAEIRQALADAGAPAPQVQVGEQGKLLSGGERRRVAVARALLTNAPVLLLDEPTAGQHPAAESHLLATLHTTRRTIILVTHRRSGPSDQRVAFDRSQQTVHSPRVARRVVVRSTRGAPRDGAPRTEQVLR